MTEHETSNSGPAPSKGTAEAEERKIKEDKKKISQMQTETRESRSDEVAAAFAERSSGINADSEGSIDPRMPNMPPA
ncbi:MAG: hypothetical protein ACR2IH_08005 [Pyrinomonadaceae bacterium]